MVLSIFKGWNVDVSGFVIAYKISTYLKFLKFFVFPTRKCWKISLRGYYLQFQIYKALTTYDIKFAHFNQNILLINYQSIFRTFLERLYFKMYKTDKKCFIFNRSSILLYCFRAIHVWNIKHKHTYYTYKSVYICMCVHCVQVEGVYV